MIVTGEVQIAHIVLVIFVKLYNIINITTKEYQSIHKDAENLTDFIRLEINRIKEIHDILFGRNFFQCLTPITQESVLITIKNLHDKLLKYSEFINDIKVSKSAI
jgi:hypothetical protein